MHRLSYSSRGSIVIECATPAVQTTVELCRTKMVLFGSGGPRKNQTRLYNSAQFFLAKVNARLIRLIRVNIPGRKFLRNGLP